jgi:branched-chain amino acid transport system substrate-binding protein
LKNIISKNAITKLQALIIAVIIVVAAIAVVYYYSQPENESEVEKTELVWGAAISLTGSMGTSGARVKAGYLSFQNLVNQRGGIEVEGKFLPLRMIIYDDKSDPTTTKLLYDRLITEDNVDFILGPFSSACAMTMAPEAEKYGYVNLQPVNNAANLYDQGYQYIFMVPPSGTTDLSSIPMFDFLADLPADERPQTIGVINAADAFGQGVEAPFADLAENYGFDYIFHEEMPVGATDVSSIISKAAVANPDVIFIIDTSATSSALVVKTMRDIDWRPKILYARSASVPDMIESIGSLATGIFYDTAYLPGELYYPSEPYNTQDFVEAFAQLYGTEPDSYPAYAFGTCQIMMNAIQAVGTMDDIVNRNQVPIRDWIRSTKHLTVVGQIQYDERGVTNPPFKAMAQWYSETETHIIWPYDLATDEFIYPYLPT